MTPVLKLYVKVFLWMGIPFALLMTLLNIGEDIRTLLIGFLFYAMFFGGGMSLLLVTLHVLRLRKDGVKSLDEGTLRVTQKKEFPFHGSLQELIDRLKKDSFFGTLEMKEEAGSLEMTTHTSWWSWGENITVRILETVAGTRILEVSSRPRLSTTLVDYGKNRRNVERIAKLILPGR